MRLGRRRSWGIWWGSGWVALVGFVRQHVLVHSHAELEPVLRCRVVERCNDHSLSGWFTLFS